jgi:hypothetical protein
MHVTAYDTTPFDPLHVSLHTSDVDGQGDTPLRPWNQGSSH